MGAASVGVLGPAEAAVAAGEPNKLLFVQGLPEASEASGLTLLFQQFPGCAQ